MRNGDFESAYKFAKEGANVSARISAGQGEAGGRMMQAMIARMQGRFDEALEIGGQALAISQASGLTYFEAVTAAMLGAIELDISPDRVNAMTQLHQLSLEALEKPLGSAVGAMAWAEIGFCALNLGQPEQANELFDNGLNISTAAKILAKPQLMMGKAMLQMMDGDIPGALEMIDDAQAFAESSKMQHYAPFFGLMRGMMYGADGNLKSALESLENCKTEALQLGMLPTALQASLVAAGIVGGQDDAIAAENIVTECEKLIDEIANSIKDSQISEAFATASRAKLPA